jgi:hypothetical protein
MAPTQSCATAPTPSPSESGCGMRWLPSAALRLAWSRTPRLAARVAAADRRACAEAVLPQPSGSCFQTHWFLRLLLFIGAATQRSRNHFSTQRGGFCTPGTAGTFTASTNTVPVQSAGTAQEVGPLTSSPPSRGQSWGGALWRVVYTPGDSHTIPAYSSQYVQCLYINHLLSVNKLVLSYLLLRLLPQVRI